MFSSKCLSIFYQLRWIDDINNIIFILIAFIVILIEPRNKKMLHYRSLSGSHKRKLFGVSLSLSRKFVTSPR